jgi:YD repeat-containing protein
MFKKTEKPTITVPGAADGTAEVLFENRTVPVKGGQIVDDFAFGPAPILPKLPPPPGTDHNPPYRNQEPAGDPVSTFTGAFSDTHVDRAIPGRGPAIQFSRSYNSNDTRVTTIGPGWTHSYNTRLTSPGDGTNDVILVGPQGRSDRYTWTGTAFGPPTGEHRTLVKNPDDTYTAADKSQASWLFDPSGRLSEIRDRYGNASTLTYDDSGRLASISDPAGRGLLTTRLHERAPDLGSPTGPPGADGDVPVRRERPSLEGD